MNLQDPLKDRSISITQFVDNRSIEIQQFIKTLNEKTCTKKVRLVPKNIRRRAMSHNRYRIPLRHRVAIISELKTNQSMQKIPRCRKTIRKKHLLVKQYKKRLSKIRWLGNHLWSAKRMRMIQYFGYKIGLNPNQKSDRASYRFSRYGCCLMNLSFYEILLLKFQQTTDIKNLLTFFEKIPQKQTQYVDTNFYLSGKFICPVTIYKNNLQFIVLYHPAARQQIDQLTINGCLIQILTQKVEIYRLMGHESLEKVNLLLNNIGYKSEPGSLTSLFKNKTNPCFYDNNLSIQIDITGCKCENKLILSPSKAITEYIKQDYEPHKIQQSILNQANSNQKDHNLFWKHVFSESNHQGKFQFSTRSKYTHKRKDKMTKQQKQKMIKDNPLASVTPKKEKDKIIEEKQQVVYEIKQPKKEKNIPERRILISLINNNDDTDGCLLIFSNFDFSYIWRKLTFLNCKVIGLHQYQTILNQNQQRVYPKDYPETQGYSKLFAKSIDDKIIRFRRKPQAKVANYQQLHSPFPFGITGFLFNSYLKQNIQLKKIKCVCVGRGTIPAFSYICRPTKTDIYKLKQYLTNNEGVSFVYKEEQVPTEKINRKQMLKYTNSQLIQYFMNTKMDRQLIGFTTSGGVNLKISKGYGLGQIRQNYLLPYVLIRKPSSPFYFVAEIFY